MVNYKTLEFQVFKDSLESINNEIYNSLKKIDEEFENIDKIVKTPKSTKEVPKIIMYMREQLQEIQEEKELLQENLKLTMTEYQDATISIERMVGDKS